MSMASQHSRALLFAFIVGWSVCVVVADKALGECLSDICERKTSDELGSLPDVSQFSVFLEANKHLSLSEFQDQYSSEKNLLEEVTFDPLQAQYFDMFMDNNRKPKSDHQTFDEMSYSATQRDAFKKNGFIVTEEEQSMGLAYYELFNNDLPVLITSDSILHAFHKSYDSMLEDLEGNVFFYALTNIFEGMRTALSMAAGNYLTGPLQQSFNDIDFFITVGANLLNAEQHYRPDPAQAPPVQTGVPKRVSRRNKQENLVKAIIPTLFSGYDQVESALKACNANSQLSISLFGESRIVDFTLFQPRGHYAKSAQLRQYFRAMNWLGEIDFEIAGLKASSSRQLGAAVVLNMLLKNSGQDRAFKTFMDAIQDLVGPSNSLDMHQFDHFLNQLHGPTKYEDLNSHDALENIQKEILNTKLGIKGYNGDSRRFSFMGKKFALDGWVQFQLVSHNSNPMMWQEARVSRFSTSAVEVAFSVLANNDSTPIILQRINDRNSKFSHRDGLMYHHHLVATRKVVDSLHAESWAQSIYMKWLNALRKLSLPRSENFPQAMRTKAYSMKNTNTQLGSWAQLRHDNILYVEQPRGSSAKCEYPDGYVEPFIEFWEAMEALCEAVVTVARKLPSEEMQNDPLMVFKNFKTQISVRELEQKPLTSEQTEFLKSVVEIKEFGSGGEFSWLGWYPQLFYGGPTDVINPDLIVCDTFTNPPSMEHPGCVVHQALGYPRRMNIPLTHLQCHLIKAVMAVENGDTSIAYAGPVFGFYEFELPGLTRMNDEAWKEQVKQKTNPALPEWTSSYVMQE